MPSTGHVDGNDVVRPANWRMYPDFQACIDGSAKFFDPDVNRRYAACWQGNRGGGKALTRERDWSDMLSFSLVSVMMRMGYCSYILRC